MGDILTFLVLLLIILFLMVACVLVLLTKPNRFRFFEMPALYCHRGLHDETVPENSLAAFRKAAEKGYGVELDVRMTKDGKIVVFHDKTLSRMCGVDGDLADFSFEELSEFRLGGSEEKIPLFSDVLNVLGGVPVSCEIKADNLDFSVNEEFLRKVYEHLNGYSGNYNIISFHPFVLKWFYEHHPEIIRGLLALNVSKNPGNIGKGLAFSLSNLLFNTVAKPDFISYRYGDKSLGWHLCRYYGTRLCTWTIHSMDEVEKAAYDGYSTFVCEGFDVSEV